MAYISVGTGIAAGLILNGTLYRGTHGLAGEIGHMAASVLTALPLIVAFLVAQRHLLQSIALSGAKG